MDTKRLWPETVVSGFFYFAGFIFMLIRLLGLNDAQIGQAVNWIFDKDRSLIVLLSAAIFGGSYLCGSLAGRLMIDIFHFFGPPLISCLARLTKMPRNAKTAADRKDIELVRIMAAAPQDMAEDLRGRYAAKYFYRSMIGGIAFLVIASSKWGICSNDARISSSIWILSAIILIMFLIAFFKQRTSHKDLLDALTEYYKSQLAKSKKTAIKKAPL